MFVGRALPLQALGKEPGAAERAVRRLHEERGGRAVFVSCDDPRVMLRTGVEFLRIKSIWTGTVPEIQNTILAWTRDRLRDGDEQYVLGRWCLPEEWITPWSQDPFDLYFLEQHFRLVPTRMAPVPVAHTPVTNPFGWRRADTVRLEPKTGAP